MAASTMSPRTLQGVNRLADYGRIFLRRDSAPLRDTVSLLDAMEGMQAFLRLREYLHDSLKLAFDEAFSGQIDDYNAYGAVCRATIQVALVAFEAVHEDVATVAGDTAPEDMKDRLERMVEEFRKAETDIRRMEGEFEKNWPWVDESLLEKSLVGEGAARRWRAKEAFDEIRSGYRRKGD
jgi:hypothetical protein